MGERSRSVAGRRLRIIVIVIAVVVGAGLVLLADAFGRCDAFGGTCPAELPATADDDTFGFAALGPAMASCVPVLLAGERDRPRWSAASSWRSRRA